MFQTPMPTPTTTAAGILSHRLIDPNAIDITSLKGQFAWEKIPQSDIYMPVIFRYVNNEFKVLHNNLLCMPLTKRKSTLNYTSE